MFKFFVMLNCKKTCPLSLHARLVYSYLAYRMRVKQGANLTELRDSLPLWDTVKPALDELVKYKLVSLDDKNFRALEPSLAQRDWFVPSSRKGLHWSDSYIGHKFYLPTKACPLSPQALAVYCLALDFDRQDKLPSVSLFSVLLNIHSATVRRAFKSIEDSGLATFRKADPRRWDIVPHAMRPEWFVQGSSSSSSEVPKWLQVIQHFKPSERLAFRIDSLIKLLRPFYPKNYIGQIVPTSEVVDGFDTVMLELVSKTLQDWDNKTYPSPLPLLHYNLRELYSNWQRRDERYDRYYLFKNSGREFTEEELASFDKFAKEQAG